MYIMIIIVLTDTFNCFIMEFQNISYALCADTTPNMFNISNCNSEWLISKETLDFNGVNTAIFYSTLLGTFWFGKDW